MGDRQRCFRGRTDGRLSEALSETGKWDELGDGSGMRVIMNSVLGMISWRNRRITEAKSLTAFNIEGVRFKRVRTNVKCITSFWKRRVCAYISE